MVKEKTKFEKLKEAISNPPPERLAKIEYKSHFYQMFGIAAVCIILIAKGFWFVIFAFIFGVGISYSQGISSYQRYVTIMKLINPEKVSDYEKDISFTRRRGKIIESVIPNSRWLAILSSVILSVMVIDPTLSRWILMIIYPLTLFVFYAFIYYFVCFWISYPIYKKRLKVK